MIESNFDLSLFSVFSSIQWADWISIVARIDLNQSGARWPWLSNFGDNHDDVDDDDGLEDDVGDDEDDGLDDDGFDGESESVWLATSLHIQFPSLPHLSSSSTIYSICQAHTAKKKFNEIFLLWNDSKKYFKGIFYMPSPHSQKKVQWNIISWNKSLIVFEKYLSSKPQPQIQRILSLSINLFQLARL